MRTHGTNSREDLRPILRQNSTNAPAVDAPASPGKRAIAAPASRDDANELLAKAEVDEPPVAVEQLATRCGAQLVRRRFDDALSGLRSASR
jgi:hypothetical protein